MSPARDTLLSKLASKIGCPLTRAATGTSVGVGVGSAVAVGVGGAVTNAVADAVAVNGGVSVRVVVGTDSGKVDTRVGVGFSPSLQLTSKPTSSNTVNRSQVLKSCSFLKNACDKMPGNYTTPFVFRNFSGKMRRSTEFVYTK